jgi:GT2 family glycosyltransferase
MHLSIVILNYKRAGLVKNCLKSVLEYAPSCEHEVIVVDNGSDDGLEKLIKEKFPDVKFLQTGNNLGMGGGNNHGMRSAQGEYVLVVNPDIFFFNNSIDSLLEFIGDKDDVGLLSPQLLNPDRSLQHTCYRWHNFWTPIFRRTFLGKTRIGKRDLHRFLMLDWDHHTVQEVDWIQGSCFLVPKKVLDQVGHFDEQFFMYFEDTDLCRRIKKAGYKNIYHAHTQVVHLHRRESAEGGALKFVFNKLTRVHIVSWIKYMWKWYKIEKASR